MSIWLSEQNIIDFASSLILIEDIFETFPIKEIESLFELVSAFLKKVDQKIIAIAENDPLYNTYHSLRELPPHIVEEISHFFQHYKELEHGKDTIIEGVRGSQYAKQVIAEAIERYNQKFPDKK